MAPIVIQLPTTSAKAGQILVIRGGKAKWVETRAQWLFWSRVRSVVSFFKRFAVNAR